ncbi:hypothetical protein TRFO_28884 [Tritrichomonas foetus]|uniref:HECT-type E3 ubiquitin transferase n=1 Tax=Tritrichomonas foetus TaxID=1144522 RepID=A0A1J4JY64_9EUKA|nr:hypothetical protein TRFO_28884 [Tritrichomonas foetus]|eukprot:OHT03634.1 hypothetical protein TRFO_28884 [Tritrichomonas foetus]
MMMDSIIHVLNFFNAYLSHFCTIFSMAKKSMVKILKNFQIFSGIIYFQFLLESLKQLTVSYQSPSVQLFLKSEMKLTLKFTIFTIQKIIIIKEETSNFTMDFDLGISFTPDSYETILMLLGADDEDCKIDGLMILSNTLVYGNAELLSEFPCGKMAECLVNILNTSTNIQSSTLSSQCIHHFLEAHPNSTRALVEHDALPSISTYIQNNNNGEVIKNLIKALGIISEYRPMDISDKIGISPFLRVFDTLKINEQRVAAQSMMRVADASNNDCFASDLKPLMSLINHSDEVVMTSAISTIGSIIQKNNKDNIPIELIPKLIDTLNTINSGVCAVSLLRSLTNLTMKNEFAEAILEHPINYKRLLFEADFKGNSGEVKRLALNIVVNLLPDTEFPNEYWRKNNRTLKGTPKFAKFIQPLLVEIILSKAGWETLTLAALAATMTVEPLEFTDDLLSAMVGLVQTSLFTAFVLLVIIHLPDPSIIVKVGILQLFKTTSPDPDIAEWYAKTLAELLEKLGPLAKTNNITKKKFRNFTQLCEFVTKNEINPSEFVLSGLLNQARDFLKNLTSLPEPVKPAVEKMIELTFANLNYLPIPRIPDPLGSYTPDELLSRIIPCSIKTPEETISDITIGIDLDFCGLEAWYNTRKDRVSKETMMEALQNSPYKDIIKLENPEELFHTQKGLIHRALNLPKMKRYHFKIENKEYSAFDSFFHSIVRSISEPSKITSPLSLEFIEGDAPRAPLNVALDIHDETLSALRFLELIHKICPEIKIHSDSFDARILGQISSPMLTIGLCSPSAQILYHFPFLFNYELRHTFFRIIGLDLSYSLPFINNFFFKVPWNTRTNSMRVKCHIRRDHLFEDGVKMLEAVGPGMLRIDVYFDNEEGIGAGPTQEFFTLFSQELCLKRRGMFNFDSTDDSDYCFNEQGLFPRPDADPKLFYLFGLLCGKVILMDMILTLPINTAFFKLVRGETITVNDVDRRLNQSLEHPEGLIGLNFTYPGLPNFELCKKGANKDVTKRNCKDYVKYVREATISLPNIVKAFREAISTIVQWETLTLFSAEEIGDLITGQEDVNITLNELKENVIVSHGYTEDSPQVQYLFDTLLGFDKDERSAFFKFVTGSAKLPIGGIKSLKPKLTLAVRAPMDGQSPDDSLPSVLTCANYLKIPEYSSKEILEQKLSLAIMEGQGSFLLT